MCKLEFARHVESVVVSDGVVSLKHKNLEQTRQTQL